ncbi:MAG TPA: hypothetical protein PLX89_05385 [Verrucomicrobiota bacterium]|nr:hypothetical protein [Verrucomicrobiota bacterium]
MNMPQPIAIMGGGLAGLSLGIALRNRNVPVTIHEAGNYPRHRVCGEFLSGAGQTILDRHGLMPACLAAGGRWARTVAFATESRLGPVHTLPSPAFCLSRYTLDALLANEFVKSGGELHTHERGVPVPNQPGIVHATGRRPSAQVKGWRWFGVKCHVRHVPLSADLELHFGPSAYVGLCRLAEDVVNVCGLFRRRSDERKPAPSDPRDWLRGSPGSIRFERLLNAEWLTHSLCTVAGLDLRPRRASERTTLRLGDALTMIPPFTGNGMSLALESAALATDPLVSYSRGETDWASACAKFGRAIDSTFTTRLRCSAWLQRLLFLPAAPALLLQLTRRDGCLLRQLFAVTRGG